MDWQVVQVLQRESHRRTGRVGRWKAYVKAEGGVGSGLTVAVVGRSVHLEKAHEKPVGSV